MSDNVVDEEDDGENNQSASFRFFSTFSSHHRKIITNTKRTLHPPSRTSDAATRATPPTCALAFAISTLLLPESSNRIVPSVHPTTTLFRSTFVVMSAMHIDVDEYDEAGPPPPPPRRRECDETILISRWRSTQ